MTPAQKIPKIVSLDNSEALIFLENLTEEVEAKLVSKQDALDRLDWFMANYSLFCRFTVV